jgi:hypothetical protein
MEVPKIRLESSLENRNHFHLSQLIGSWESSVWVDTLAKATETVYSHIV